ncbi:MAG: arylesterase [Alphaproteobacteria bacterium]|nr:arylesterase [Alphaproteobacteria bacterium]MBU1515959.1 arylesterase [Alphaproteobacteria bacterium]MBU2092826.1 arylesterase [Alphaproteobacteria bacterium]MBU2153649.1 arylesterase [Alphaproteobacteria bacterium]MBU2308277.1 arylesterase [Alphaproteobacteria bacterium]
MAAPRPTRRSFAFLPLIVAAGPAFAARIKVVTVLGDSITAGYGLPVAAALPAQLHLALTKLGAANLVRAAGVSGDTTAGGLARVDFSVKKDTDVVVIALGANDLLQGQDPKRTRANLDGIIRKLKARKIGVVLAGIAAPVEIGGGYARDFNAVFPALARAHGVPLYPNLLDGVARTPTLNQPDGIHPNARGAQIIAARLAPTVAKALAARA